MDSSRKVVFVTGAMGFLGTHLCDSLVKDGHTVVALQRDWTIRYGPHAAQHVVHGDVCDRAVLERAFAEYSPDAVIHLAAQAQVSAASADPTSAFQSNLMGTLAVLEASRLKKIKRVIVASTDKVYGESPQAYTEDSPLAERNPYGASKVCADVMAQTYQKHYGMSVAVTRCGNLYGPGHFNWSTLIPGTLRRFQKRESAKLRFGGRAVRDFLHVNDAVRAYTDLLQSSVTGAFNFSGGSPCSILLITEVLAEYWGGAPKIDVTEEGNGEIFAQALDCVKAADLLGWRPNVKLSKGLEMVTCWYKNYFKENPCV